MLLSKSIRRKVLATALAACSFVLLYNATVIDSRAGADRTPSSLASVAGSRLEFVATAYCKGETTSAGVSPQSGIAAADPGLLPEGSVVEVDGAGDRYRGIYTVMDTGPKVAGRHRRPLHVELHRGHGVRPPARSRSRCCATAGIRGTP